MLEWQEKRAYRYLYIVWRPRMSVIPVDRSAIGRQKKKKKSRIGADSSANLPRRGRIPYSFT